ncbi:hypothetical protein [Streptomyces sp. R35]|uniref:Uncharacterized protein n=1 Tax=Streptomyces sp. R35 TaxID=3238630 RepID=A0AB39SKZ5_9ACTN
MYQVRPRAFSPSLRVRNPVISGIPRNARPPREGLRPLRDPATVHLDEEDEGTGE